MQLDLNDKYGVVTVILQEKRKKHNKDQNVKYQVKREENKECLN